MRVSTEWWNHSKLCYPSKQRLTALSHDAGVKKSTAKPKAKKRSELSVRERIEQIYARLCRLEQRVSELRKGRSTNGSQRPN
jgi:hypothetical protein